MDSIEAKESKFLSGENRYYVKPSMFDMIPGAPIAYWASDQFVENYKKCIFIDQIAVNTGSQNKPANNDKYVRFVWEVDANRIGPGNKWVIYSKGGESRKYYGNLLYVVDWSNEARSFYKNNPTSNLLKEEYWYEEGITYTKVSSKGTSFRYLPSGCVFDTGGPSIVQFKHNLFYILGFLNSKVCAQYLNIINPTINVQTKDISKIPLLIDKELTEHIEMTVRRCVSIAQDDWDSSETSHHFQSNPLILTKQDKVEDAFKILQNNSKVLRVEMEEKQQNINSHFNKIYGMDTDTSDTVDLKIITPTSAVKELLSYAVGCIFGRYSLDVPGIILSNPTLDRSQYTSIIPDDDNIVLIDDGGQGNDIVYRLVEFIKVAFGEKNLEDNLKFIADNLGIKYNGTARDGIRKYFLNDYYDDHIRTFHKCPIYWLFDSGNDNGFKALVYMHRYTPDLISKMRQDYLLPTLSRYTEQVKYAEGALKIEIQKKIEEIQVYDIAMEKYASVKVSIDLDDGVKVNYAKFQNIENPGSKKKINLLHPLK